MADFAIIVDKTIRLIILYMKNFSLNCYRRILIFLKYLGIVWQRRRMARQYRLFGASIYAKLDSGDVNPLLQEEVRDQITSLQSLQENILLRQAAIEQIREQIKATSYRMTTPSADPKTEPEGGETID